MALVIVALTLARWRQAPRRRACASSAAADGVAARRSATKSAIVTSVSWPIAAMTGTRAAADAPGDGLQI